MRGHYLFREANSFPRAKLEENCELGGTDNVRRQISEHIFTAKLRLLCLLSIGFKNWEISWDNPQFWLGNIRPCDTFRPIAGERKYLIDYNNCYYDCPFDYGFLTEWLSVLGLLLILVLIHVKEFLTSWLRLDITSKKLKADIWILAFSQTKIKLCNGLNTLPPNSLASFIEMHLKLKQVIPQ